jgi:hypothetical protein
VPEKDAPEHDFSQILIELRLLGRAGTNDATAEVTRFAALPGNGNSWGDHMQFIIIDSVPSTSDRSSLQARDTGVTTGVPSF